MPLADYFSRNALAAAQVLAGFDEHIFAEKLEAQTVGISFGTDATSTAEGRALLDLLVRLVARLYPRLSLRAGPGGETYAAELADLAKAINPRISVNEETPSVVLAVGLDAPQDVAPLLHIGAVGWAALLSVNNPCPIGASSNPFGAGAAACLGAANLFRWAFLASSTELLDRDRSFSTLIGEAHPIGAADDPSLAHLEGAPAVLVGLGAVGNGAAWALARVIGADSATLHLVDPQEIELSNLQRYVLAARNDEGRVKVDLAASFFQPGVAQSHGSTWADFVAREGHHWKRVLVALDSARDRRAVQASLPEWIANAWTQPGDLGVSVHRLDGVGACLVCLYLPHAARESDDALVAKALGVPDQIDQIRTLLYTNEPAPRPLLERIADRLGVAAERVLAFEGRAVRSLYVEGICGGAVLPLGQAGTPRSDVHVPLAHQSALAGVLLAARLADPTIDERDAGFVTRVDVLKPLGRYLTQPALKDPRGICICQDADYIAAYDRKYGGTAHNGVSDESYSANRPSPSAAES